MNKTFSHIENQASDLSGNPFLTSAEVAILPGQLRGARAALVVAHPGHELRMHGWMELARPRTFALTDGSGRDKSTRLSSTSRILGAVGANAGGIFGRLADREVYQLLLGHRFDVFVGLAEELADELAREAIDYVVGDAAEDRILTHDICRLVINAAVKLLSRKTGKQIVNYDFSPNQPNPDKPSPGTITLDLSSAMLDRKIQASLGYYEIQNEVESAIQELRMDGLRLEMLRPVENWNIESYQLASTPQYELHGLQLVNAGIYPTAIRYRDHVLPLIDALNNHLEKNNQ